MKILKFFKRSVLNYIEFEKQCSDLNYIVNYEASKTVEIENLLIWYRKEYSKLPHQYPGDHIPIQMVKEKVMTGELLYRAIEIVKSQLSIEIERNKYYARYFKP